MPKCAECGFFSLRNRLTGNLDEMDADFRRTGNPPHREIPVVGGAGNKFALVDTTPYRHVPVCFAQSVDLAKECPGTEELLAKYKDWPAELVLEVITKDRPECEGKFTPWQQGFAPKEHREMLDRQELRNWEAAQRHEDRRWRIIELIVFGAVATGVGAGVAILAAFIERGSWP